MFHADLDDTGEHVVEYVLCTHPVEDHSSQADGGQQHSVLEGADLSEYDS